MNLPVRPLTALAGLILAVTGPAARADIVLGPVDRHVEYSYTEIGPPPIGAAQIQTNNTGGPFLGDVGVFPDFNAFQGSNIAPLMIMANGTVDLNLSDISQANAESVFDIFFTLNSPHAYTLAGSLSLSLEVGDGESTFSLTGPGTNLSFANPDTSGTVDIFGGAGVLGPGVYHLVVGSVIDAGQNDSVFASGSYTSTLQLRPLVVNVPEPASLVVWGLLAIGGGAAWRRKVARVG